MEKSENRKQFMVNFQNVLATLVKLKGPSLKLFLEELLDHPYFQSYNIPLNALSYSETAQKVFVLTELTKERFSCHGIHQLLVKHEQQEAAKLLLGFNTSPGVMPLSTEIRIPVNSALHIKDYLSNTYNLRNSPRGVCVIINNVRDPESNGLEREALRFQFIFEWLYFEVKELSALSANQLKKELENIRKNNIKENQRAFVLINLSHGEDKYIFGYSAGKNDKIKMKDLISIFSEENCPQLQSKPKLYFFICCRIFGENDSIHIDQAYGGDNKPALVKTFDIDVEDIQSEEPMEWEPQKESNSEKKKKPIKRTPELDTFVSYSCAKGYLTYFDRHFGMTYFGQALTHSIAQYACDESLDQIMKRTCKRLDEMYDKSRIQLSGCFAIQVNTFHMKNELYFNPGYFDNRDGLCIE